MDLLNCFKYNEKQKNDMQKKKNEILSKLNGIKSKILKAIQFFFIPGKVYAFIIEDINGHIKRKKIEK